MLLQQQPDFVKEEEAPDTAEMVYVFDGLFQKRYTGETPSEKSAWAPHCRSARAPGSADLLERSQSMTRVASQVSVT